MTLTAKMDGLARVPKRLGSPVDLYLTQSRSFRAWDGEIYVPASGGRRRVPTGVAFLGLLKSQKWRGEQIFRHGQVWLQADSILVKFKAQ